MVEDIESFVVEEEILINGKKFIIKPLGFFDILKIIKKLNIQLPKETNKEVFWGKIFDNIVDCLPEILISCVNGLTEKTMKRLPANIVSGLVVACIEINLNSQKGLEDNLKKFIEIIKQVMGMLPTKKIGESENISKS